MPGIILEAILFSVAFAIQIAVAIQFSFLNHGMEVKNSRHDTIEAKKNALDNPTDLKSILLQHRMMNCFTKDKIPFRDCPYIVHVVVMH